MGDVWDTGQSQRSEGRPVDSRGVEDWSAGVTYNMDPHLSEVQVEAVCSSIAVGGAKLPSRNKS